MAKNGKKLEIVQLGMLPVVGSYIQLKTGVWVKAPDGMLVVESTDRENHTDRLMVGPLEAFARNGLVPACVARVVRDSRQVLSLTVAGKTVPVWQAPDRELRAGHHLAVAWMEAAAPPAVQVVKPHDGPYIQLIPPHEVGRIRAGGGRVTPVSPFGGK